MLISKKLLIFILLCIVFVLRRHMLSHSRLSTYNLNLSSLMTAGNFLK